MTSKTEKSSRKTNYQVSFIKPHNEYKEGDRLRNDIAILGISMPVNTKIISPACLSLSLHHKQRLTGNILF